MSTLETIKGRKGAARVLEQEKEVSRAESCPPRKPRQRQLVVVGKSLSSIPGHPLRTTSDSLLRT